MNFAFFFLNGGRRSTGSRAQCQDTATRGADERAGQGTPAGLRAGLRGRPAPVQNLGRPTA